MGGWPLGAPCGGCGGRWFCVSDVCCCVVLSVAANTVVLTAGAASASDSVQARIHVRLSFGKFGKVS